MASGSIEKLQNDIIADLTIELQGEPEFNIAKLAIKVKDAIRKVKSARGYQNTSYTEEKIEQDLYDNYYAVVKDLALYYWNKMGAEFELSHDENDTYRTYISESEILGNVKSFVKIF